MQHQEPDFCRRLNVSLRARVTLIVVMTPEEERVVSRIQEVCDTWDPPRQCVTWDAVDGATLYRTWYSTTNPYFTSGGTLAQENGNLTFTHANVATSLTNYYYVIRAVDAGGIESSDSKRTGKFTFPLTPGS